MDCRNAQEAILESFDDAGGAEARREIHAHLADCPACAGFAARQQAVDARLGRLLTAPEMSPGVRKALRQRIRREETRQWTDSLPDKVHFASCGLATVMCAIFMPVDAAAVLMAGSAATVVTYILLTEVRCFFEDTGDTDR